jgi:type IV pilus assembly protein PilV
MVCNLLDCPVQPNPAEDNTMSDFRNCQSGFTLLELLIALTIFAIGLLSIAGMQVTAIQANSSANTLSVTGAVAQKAMEEILSQDGTALFFSTAATDAVWDLDLTEAATTLNLDGAGEYSATYTVTPDTPTNNVTRVIVTVTGSGKAFGGGQRSVSLTSYKRAI